MPIVDRVRTPVLLDVFTGDRRVASGEDCGLEKGGITICPRGHPRKLGGTGWLKFNPRRNQEYLRRFCLYPWDEVCLAGSVKRCAPKACPVGLIVIGT
jgi:hypothetical protein